MESQASFVLRLTVVAAGFLLVAGLGALQGLPARAASAAAVQLASDGHPTHPVWYHDSAAVQVGSTLYLAWTTDHASVSARAYDRSAGAFAGSPVKVSVATLDCQCVDSTGTNPNRHDVPALYADPAGRVYALYGGGTASRTDGKTGPFFRAAAVPGSIDSWGTETRLDIPGGAMDLEAVTDHSGVTDLVGQQGDNRTGAGSLLFLRFDPGSASGPGAFEGTPPYATLVRGGRDPQACAWLSPPGCNIYVIGRLALGPSNPSDPSAPQRIFAVWGWSELNLSNTCGNPLGFCNHGLYFAYSDDGGATWFNAAGTTGTAISPGAGIAYDDPNYKVVAPRVDVGLFKALAVTGPFPGTPWIFYQPRADVGTGVIEAVHATGPGTWVFHTVDSSRPWNNHLVARSTSGGGLVVWSDIAQSGNFSGRIAQWTLPQPGHWTKTTLPLGRNWFLTGRAVPGGEVLMWRGPATQTSSEVMFSVVPVP